MSIFEHEDYRDYLRTRIRLMPSRGKGELKRLAARLEVHPSLISQILKGDRDFSSEQGLKLAEALGLNDSESEYLLALIDFSRAESERLKTLIRRRLRRLREGDRAGTGEARPGEDEVSLSENERALFYSNWFYSAIRLRSAIAPAPTLDQLASDLGLPRTLVRQVTEFLIEKGLCIENAGRIQIGPRRTWIDQSSPLVLRHHQNWRLRSLDRMPKKEEHEFFLTLPMTIARKDLARLKELALAFESQVHELLDQTESEELICLNLDLFRVRA